MKRRLWYIFQLSQLLGFILMSLFLWTRAVDGHGTLQTFDTKLLSFGVWLAFYLGLMLIEWGIYGLSRYFARH